MALDETRTAGEKGHLSDHDSLHKLYNATVEAAVYDEATESWNGSSLTDLWVTPGDMSATQGAPSLAALTGSATPIWLLDPASNETVSANVRIPEDWTTFDFYVWVENDGGGAGDWMARSNVNAISDGDNANVGLTLGADVTTVADAQYVADRVLLTAGITRSGAVMMVGVQRRANQAGDTLANDLGVLAIELVKAS